MSKSKALKRIVSSVLAVTTLLTQMPMRALAEELAPAEDVYLPENTMDEDILTSDVFYMPSSTIRLEEGSKSRYILRIGRGGDCQSASSVNVKISDLTAKYGRDYKITALDGKEKVNNPDDNQSLMERIEGEDYVATPMISEEEFAEKIEEDPRLKEEAASAVNDAISMIEEQADLLPGTEAAPADGSESVNINPLLEARSKFTQIDGDPQKVTATSDTYQQIQQIADVITNAVVGANLRVEFAEGESERFIAIDAIDNDEGDGDRYFYLMLADPEGTTTVSGAATCAGTIADDEEQLPSEVSFGKVEYDSESDNVSVEVKREGALNTIADVRLKTVSGTAKLGRDVSPVDMSVAFPIGIDTREINIPVNTEFISDTAEFALTLEETAGAVVKTAEKKVTLTHKAPYTIIGQDTVYKAKEEARNLGTIKVDSALNLRNTAGASESGNYKSGANSFRDDNWRMEWLGKWNGPFKRHYGSVGAEWKLSSYNGFEYSGIQIDWGRTGNCATIKLGFEGKWAFNNSSARDYLNRIECANKGGFGRHTKNVFSAINDPVYVDISNHSGCGDCNVLSIYSIKPIFRIFDVSISSGNKLTFLQEDGSYKTDSTGSANYLAIDGSSNNSGNSGYFFADETITFRQAVGGNTTTPFTYVKSIKTDTGVKFAEFNDPGKKDYQVKLTKQFINDNSTYDNKGAIKFEKNSKLYNDSTTDNDAKYGTYGKLKLEPLFGYKDVTVKVNVPAGAKGYLNFSGTRMNYSSTTTVRNKYHQGDIIKVSTTMYDDYKDAYVPAGFRISYKTSESDTKWVNKDAVYTYNASGFNFFNDGKKLKYGYYEITPLFQLKNNSVIVRVKESDVKKYDASYGIFADVKGSKNTIDGVDYMDYVVYNDIKAGQVYSLAAKPLDAKTGNVWDLNTDKGFTGELFYIEASADQENNIVMLTPKTVKTEKDIPYYKFSGALRKNIYNMSTMDYMAAMLPVCNAGVIGGRASAVTNKKGEFSLAPFKCLPDSVVRYVVAVNGEMAIKSFKTYSASRAKLKDIEIVDDDKNIKKISAYVIEINQDTIPINNESNSIVDNIEVWAEDFENGGGSIQIDTNKPIVLKAKCKAPLDYLKPVKTNGVVKDVPAKENLTGVEFVIRDTNTNELIKSYTAEYDSKTGEYSAAVNMGSSLPGQSVYMNITTDKAVNADASFNNMAYNNIYTGYFFAQKTTEDAPPPEANIAPVADVSFVDLPLIGDSGFNFDFPFVSVSIEKTRNGGYRMSIGVSPLQIADKVKDTSVAGYSNLEDQFKDIFSIKSPFQSFSKLISSSTDLVKTMKQTADPDIGNARDIAKTAATAMGGPTWKFDVSLGAYFDFAAMQVKNSATGEERTDIIFTGVGGYISVSGGFKMTWYTILPVVFLPAYFGIEIDANILGQFGASTDTSKPVITYNDAFETQVKYEDSLGNFDMTLKMSAAVTIYVGVGIAGLLGLRGGAKAEVMGMYAPNDKFSDWGAMITFTASIWVDLFLFSLPLSYTFPELTFGSFQEYKDSLNKEVPQSVTAGELAIRAPYSEKNSQWLPDGNKTIKAYSNDSAVMGSGTDYMAGFSENSSYTLVSDGYEHPEVQLLKLSDGSIFMAFLDNAKGRAASERTVLKYSVFENGKWTTPAAVNDNGTADFQPSICEMDDCKVMISWVSSDPETKKSGEAADYLSSLEIYSAVIDKSADKPVSEISRLTDDEYYDYKPMSIYDDVTGDRAVYYVKTASTGSAEEMVNSYTNDCVIVYMLCSDPDGDGVKTWLTDYYYDEEVENDDDRQELIENWRGQRFLASPVPELGMDVPNISDMTAASYNGLAVFAYTIDQDSSNDTSYDKELFIQFYDFENHYTYVPVRVTNDSVCDAVPQLIRVGTGEDASTKLFWYRNERDVVYIDISDLVKHGLDEDGNILDSYRQDENAKDDLYTGIDRIYQYVQTKAEGSQGYRSMADFKAVVDGENVYVVWTQASSNEKDENAFCREVYATALIQPTDKQLAANKGEVPVNWSNPYRLTYANDYTDEPSVVIDKNGNMMVVYNQYHQEMTDDPENPLVISDFKLKASYMEPCGAVEAYYVAPSNLTPVKGEKVSVTVGVENNGLTYAEGYTIEVFAKYPDGKKVSVGKEERDVKLAPGERADYTAVWTAPESVEGIVFEAEVFEKGGKWTNKANAVSDALMQRAEYEVSEIDTYQSGGDFYITYKVENTGNALSTSDDRYTVNLIGPYGNTFGCSEEERIFGTQTLEGIEAGGSKTYTTKLTAPYDIFDVYGYVNCLAVVKDKDDNYRTDGDDVRLTAVCPMNIKLNGEAFPETITLKKGETLKLDVTCSPADVSDKLSAVFSTEDPAVAAVDGNTIEAIKNGSTVVYGLADPYGTELPEFIIKVVSDYLLGDISKNGSIDLQDAIIIAKSLVGSVTIADEDIPIADYNESGEVDLQDAIGIAKYLLRH